MGLCPAAKLQKSDLYPAIIVELKERITYEKKSFFSMSNLKPKKSRNSCSGVTNFLEEEEEVDFDRLNFFFKCFPAQLSLLPSKLARLVRLSG